MKAIKKAICIILVTLMISGLFCPLAFAAKDFGHLPQIYVKFSLSANTFLSLCGYTCVNQKL